MLNLYKKGKPVFKTINSALSKKELSKFKDKCNKKEIQLLYVGRLAAEKGITYLLDSVKELKKRCRELFNREIYFIENVKFHLDIVKGLGRFTEIEAISEDDSINYARLESQLNYYKTKFEIKKEDLINCSYSDLLLGK